MRSTSTHQLCLSECVTFVSTEIHAPCSKDSKFLIGLLLKNNTAGNSMLTQDKRGQMQCMISTLNGLPPNLLVNVKNQTCCSGLDLNNGELACRPVSSTMRSQTQPDGDTVAICLMTLTMIAKEIEFFTHSLTATSNNQ